MNKTTSCMNLGYIPHCDEDMEIGSSTRHVHTQQSEPMFDDDDKKKLSACVIFCVVLFIVVALPMSFHGVEYNEYALGRYSLSNKVDYGTVYSHGNHYFFLLGYQMITFPSTFQYEEFSGEHALSVFSKEGLLIGFQCTFQWRIKKEAIPKIHKEFRTSYRPQVLNRVIATIKNTVVQFTTDDFILNRELIDRIITTNIGNAVTELGFEIPADKFQFAKPLLPNNVRQKYLQTDTQLVINQQQSLLFQKAQVEQQTDVMVNLILSNATKILNEATSTSNKILGTAQADSYKITESAVQNGFALLFNTLNVTDPETMSQLIKAINLEVNSDIKLYVGLAGKAVVGV